MGIAYVSANDTFLIWMLKTNQSIDYQNQLNGAMNAANDKANSIYITTNAAYNNANVGLISANAYAGFMVNTATDYAGVMANSSNAYANTVGNSGNAYSVVIGISGNNYTNLSTGSANAYANFVGISSNSWSNAYSNQVGINSNTYTNVSVTAANSYAGAMSNSSNGWANAVGVSGNAYTNYVGVSGNVYANLIGASANAYMLYTANISNSYAGFMANSSNAYAYTLAYGTLSGAQGFSNGVGISANAYTNASSAAANNYAGFMANSSNGYAATLAYGGLSGAQGYSNNVGISCNSYASFVGTSGNAYMLSVTSTDRGYTNTSVTAANNWANAVGVNANTYANATFLKVSGGYVSGDVTITGNLYFSGNSTTIYSTNLVVGDSMIYLAANNYAAGDTVDIGFVGQYSNTGGANVHTGLFRDAATKQYYLFQGYDIEPGSNNNITPYANNMVNAVLNADIVTNNLTLGGANANVWIAGVSTNAAAAFLKANNVSAGANGYAQQVGASGNTYAFNIGLSGNGYTQTVGTSGNAYALSVATTIGASGNAYASVAAVSANNYAAATYAPLGGSGASGQWAIRSYPRRSDGTNIDIIWSGQSGQPSWLVGSNDGSSFYVYNPSNFSVSSATYASYCNNFQFNQSVKTDGTPTFASVYSPGFYYRDNTAYYVFNGNANARLGTAWGDYLYSYGDIRAAGYVYAVGRVIVGEGATSSMIEMRDTDEGVRYIHNNSGTIGFLNTSGNWRFRMNDDGNVVMGTYQDWLSNQIRSNIVYKHDNTGYYIFGNSSGDGRLRNVYVDYLQSYGSIYSNGDISAYSDERLKTNINTIGDAGNILNNLRGVRFDWKKDGKKSIGLIAQEVEKFVPEVINETTDFIDNLETTIKTVDYGKLVSLLIEGWKQHEQEITELKAKLKELS